MARSDTPLLLSAVVIWELRLKRNSFGIAGERKGPIAPAAVVAFAAAMEWELFPLTASHAVAELATPLAQ